MATLPDDGERPSPAGTRRFIIVTAAVIVLLMPVIWVVQPAESVAGRLAFTIAAIVLVPLVMWVKASCRAHLE